MLSNLDALQVAALAPRAAPAKLPSKQPRQGPAGPAKTSLTPAQPKLPEPTERKGHNVTRLLCTASGSYPEGQIISQSVPAGVLRDGHPSRAFGGRLARAISPAKNAACRTWASGLGPRPCTFLTKSACRGFPTGPRLVPKLGHGRANQNQLLRQVAVVAALWHPLLSSGTPLFGCAVIMATGFASFRGLGGQRRG